jgi:predicted glutamine amidotransferase
MACVVVTKTALSVRVDALADAGEKSTPSAPKISLEDRAKLEARLRSVEAESDFTVYDALPCDLISRSVSSSAQLHLPINHTEKRGGLYGTIHRLSARKHRTLYARPSSSVYGVIVSSITLYSDLCVWRSIFCRLSMVSRLSSSLR